MKLLKLYLIKDNNNKEFIKRFFRIGLSNSTISILELILKEQFSFFYDEKKHIPYEENVEHNIDSDELFIINNNTYLQNEDLINLFENNSSLGDYQELDENFFKNTKSFAFAVKYNDEYYLLFQQYKKNYVFFNKKIFTLDNKNFHLDNKDFLILPDYLSGIYKFSDKTLFFRKPYEITSTIDVSQYYKAATDKEIEENFLSKESIFECDKEKLLKNIALKIRRKISLIIKKNINEKAKLIPIETIIEDAKEYGINLNINDNKIIIPEDKKELDLFMSFFNDQMYESYFDKTKYIASGKTKIILTNDK